MTIPHDDLVLCSTGLAAFIFMTGMASRVQVAAIKDFFWDSDLRRCKCARPIAAGLLTQIILNPLIGGSIISSLPAVDIRMRIAAMIIMCSSGGMGSNLMTYIIVWESGGIVGAYCLLYDDGPSRVADELPVEHQADLEAGQRWPRYTI
jgi:hypothetical protein